MANEFDYDYFEEKRYEQEVLKMEKENESLEVYLNYLRQIRDESRTKLLILKEKTPSHINKEIEDSISSFKNNNKNNIENIIKKHISRIDLNNSNVSINIFNECLNEIKKLEKDI